ncbi:MAG: hypothetical protein COV69_00765 [Parcubacteria group bacterium CG11_big_fil_rev_8_21_14_0_20_39_14]|nr:MAG: hypothetical protein COV69_00765 [Parcubacteria group bacterium CG11_big_fil_rev_8_21_14_0_20_39_14]PIS35733.1 MAG: hypothetical protein COT36_00700 [Parcubacteria group bacterium CG08_land_8_20_14_0_20_38_56]
MTIERKPVEDYFEEQKRKFEEAVGPIKDKLLEILFEDSGRLYSAKELGEKIGLAESCCQEESCQYSDCPRYLEPALKALLAEEKIIAYPWPFPPTEKTELYFGINLFWGIEK